VVEKLAILKKEKATVMKGTSNPKRLNSVLEKINLKKQKNGNNLMMLQCQNEEEYHLHKSINLL
jgi:hypothetical protein